MVFNGANPTPSDDVTESAVSPENQEISAEASEQTTEAPQDAQTKELQRKYQDLQDQYLRLAADFDNYRKRYAQEQEALRKYGAENTARELIPVLDNLERAASSLSEKSEPKILYQSFRLMHNQLVDSLKNMGFQKMNTVGQTFDPTFHEAISQQETDEHPENTVVNEMQSGFMLHDRVLRPALVSVAVPKQNKEEAPAKSENPFAQVSADAGYSSEKSS
jgi:molecular chaperone GrpE